ncbi:Axin-1 [Trichinella spiralis]|uniref:Axin-1 n=1 Tax=Trichinella spiralis TaxID=6334 RepID=A0A0V1AVI8_TRISP|nr:Axin-1 [Trichinella spiralis]
MSTAGKLAEEAASEEFISCATRPPAIGCDSVRTAPIADGARCELSVHCSAMLVSVLTFDFNLKKRKHLFQIYFLVLFINSNENYKCGNEHRLSWTYMAIKFVLFSESRRGIITLGNIVLQALGLIKKKNSASSDPADYANESSTSGVVEMKHSHQGGGSPKSSKLNSRNHSPLLFTSKKSSRSASLSDFPKEGSEEAPLGYVPCEESDDVSPYSERATPPYMRWAVDLQNVLEDFEGLQLFKKFLTNEGCENELDFWYACKGLKQYSDKEWSLVERVAHMIHQNYVRPQGEYSLTCIRGETRVEIQKRFVAKDICQGMFDTAQMEVEAFLRIKHAAFVESDLYISYLQAIQTGGWDSPRCYSNDSRSNSSSSNSADGQRPSSTLLPTVQEEVEIEVAETDGRTEQEQQQKSKQHQQQQQQKQSPKQQQQQQQLKSQSVQKHPAASGDEATTSSSCSNKPTKSTVLAGPASTPVAASSIPVLPTVTRTTLKSDERLRISGRDAAHPTTTSFTTTSVAPSSDSQPTPVVMIKKKSSGSSGQSYGGRLTAGALVATFEQRMAYSACSRGTRGGVPPNPYHTKYVPYLPTSAQDSELQSMSSDAATDSSFGNSRSRHKEKRIIRQHIEQNRDNVSSQIFIPRTQREVVARDMMDEEFKFQVVEKLENLRRERETYEKLNESLQRLSEPENNSNSHRAAVEKFCKVEKSFRAAPEDAEAILDDYYNRVGWKDSPKQSPMRSPGFAFGSRKKSPGSKSPDRRVISRMMTTSYPLPYAMSQTLPLQHQGGSTAVMRGSLGQDQNQTMIQVPPTVPVHLSSKHRATHASATSGSGGGGGGSHRSSSRTDSTTAASSGGGTATVATAAAAAAGSGSSAAQRTSGSGKSSRQYSRYPVLTSDTSGISSGTSSDPSLVSAKIPPMTAAYNRSSTNEQWILEERPSYETESGRHRSRSSNQSGSGLSSGKSHKTSSHKSGTSDSSARVSSSEKSSRSHKMLDSSGFPNINTRKAWSMRTSSISASQSSNSSQATCQEYISVGYFLPNESTPYVTKFSGRQISLKQFKQLIPRKGNFRYFFQCASDELGTGMIQREVTDENELLPIWEGNKVVAKIVSVD